MGTSIKHTTFFSLAVPAMAAVLLVSCSKGTSLRDREIYFGTGWLSESKAVSEVTAETLKSGWRCAAVIDEGGTLMFDDRVRYSSGIYRPMSGTYYYPVSGTMSFYGVYPPEQVLSRTGTNITTSYVQTAEASADLVVATAEGIGKQVGAVQMEFSHILSQVSFKCRSKDAEVDCFVSSLKLKAPQQGVYSLSSGSWETVGTSSWWSCFNDSETAVPSDKMQGFGSPMSFIPGPGEIEVSWVCREKGSGQEIASYRMAAPIVLTEGRHSTYNLLLPNSGAEKITVNVTVRDWSAVDKEVDF